MIGPTRQRFDAGGFLRMHFASGDSWFLSSRTPDQSGT
jgi:hypothetical protein